MKTVFLRALEADDKAAALRAAVHVPEVAHGRQRFEVDPNRFSAVPRSPFAYWVSEPMQSLFTRLRPIQDNFLVASGTGTLDDFRFVRVWWELNRARNGNHMRVWPTYAKGGRYSPFYFDHHLSVEWERDGAQMKSWIVTRYGGGHWARNIRSTEHYFRPGLTWPRRTQGGFSVRAMPSGCIFADKGPALFAPHDECGSLITLLAIANAMAFRALVDLQMAFGSYEVGVIQRTPIPSLSEADKESLATLARRAWSLRRSLDTCREVSHAFAVPALLQVDRNTLAAQADAWAEQVRRTEAELAALREEIDDRCFDLYDIDEADRRAITAGFGNDAAKSDDGGDLRETEGTDDQHLLADLVSWAVGVAFGRFDVRLATGEREVPAEPEPFDALPVCSPGMLTGEDSLPVTSLPAGYPLAFPQSGVLVDDRGHADDLGTAVRGVFDVVFGEGADSWWQDSASVLDPKNHDLRTWLATRFFEYHLKQYSKSRRKAPILWQLGTPSGRYSVWLYAHRLTRDSFFQLQNDVVAAKLAHEERQLLSLLQATGGSPSAKERKQIAAQESFVEELRAMLEEVKRVAPLWNPTLDDGVVLTMAPLWRLVSQHKPWQKELRKRWEELCAGKYDWAQVAMHLWPERVVPKCQDDRSLAIAHGLEEVFWVEDEDEKWHQRDVSEARVAELVAERASPAVKDALDRLLDTVVRP